MRSPKHPHPFSVRARPNCQASHRRWGKKERIVGLGPITERGSGGDGREGRRGREDTRDRSWRRHDLRPTPFITTPPSIPCQANQSVKASRLLRVIPLHTGHALRLCPAGCPPEVGSDEARPGERPSPAPVCPCCSHRRAKAAASRSGRADSSAARGAAALRVPRRRQWVGPSPPAHEAGATTGECASWTGGSCRACTSAGCVVDPAAAAVGSDRCASSTNAEAVQSPMGRERKWA